MVLFLKNNKDMINNNNNNNPYKIYDYEKRGRKLKKEIEKVMQALMSSTIPSPPNPVYYNPAFHYKNLVRFAKETTKLLFFLPPPASPRLV